MRHRSSVSVKSWSCPPSSASPSEGTRTFAPSSQLSRRWRRVCSGSSGMRWPPSRSGMKNADSSVACARSPGSHTRSLPSSPGASPVTCVWMGSRPTSKSGRRGRTLTTTRRPRRPSPAVLAVLLVVAPPPLEHVVPGQLEVLAAALAPRLLRSPPARSGSAGCRPRSAPPPAGPRGRCAPRRGLAGTSASPPAAPPPGTCRCAGRGPPAWIPSASRTRGAWSASTPSTSTPSMWPSSTTTSRRPSGCSVALRRARR